MAFTGIDDDDQFWFAHQFNQMAGGIKGDGVVSGLSVSEKAAGANMSVDIAAGTAVVNGTTINKPSTVNVAVTAADGSNPRYDLVQMNSSGTISMKDGTAAATPVLPDPDSNQIVLAIVTVAAGATSISDANIKDMTLILSSNAITNRRDIFGTGADGAVTISANTTLTADKHYTTLTVNNGFTLFPAGYRVFATISITNNGTISRNGSNATNTDMVCGTVGGGGRGGGDGVVLSKGGQGGGIILLCSPTIDNTSGTITVTGGDGGATGTAGTYGGGGRGLGSAGPTFDTTLIMDQVLPFLLQPTANLTALQVYGGAGGGGGDQPTDGLPIGGIILGGAGGAGASGQGGGGGGGGAVIFVYSTSFTAGTVTLTGGSGGGTAVDGSVGYQYSKQV